MPKVTDSSKLQRRPRSNNPLTKANRKAANTSAFKAVIDALRMAQGITLGKPRCHQGHPGKRQVYMGVDSVFTLDDPKFLDIGSTIQTCFDHPECSSHGVVGKRIPVEVLTGSADVIRLLHERHEIKFGPRLTKPGRPPRQQVPPPAEGPSHASRSAVRGRAARAPASSPPPQARQNAPVRHVASSPGPQARDNNDSDVELIEPTRVWASFYINNSSESTDVLLMSSRNDMLALSDHKRELGDNGIEQHGMRIEVYDTQCGEFIAVSWKTGIKPEKQYLESDHLPAFRKIPKDSTRKLKSGETIAAPKKGQQKEWVRVHVVDKFIEKYRKGGNREQIFELVYNWFKNHRQTSSSEAQQLPPPLARATNAVELFRMEHSDQITAAAKDIQSGDWLNDFNETKRSMFDKLPQTDKDSYELDAKKQNEERLKLPPVERIYENQEFIGQAASLSLEALHGFGHGQYGHIVTQTRIAHVNEQGKIIHTCVSTGMPKGYKAAANPEWAIESERRLQNFLPKKDIVDVTPPNRDIETTASSSGLNGQGEEEIEKALQNVDEEVSDGGGSQVDDGEEMGGSKVDGEDREGREHIEEEEKEKMPLVDETQRDEENETAVVLTIACDQCRKAKVGCSKTSPCTRCTNKGLKCTFKSTKSPTTTAVRKLETALVQTRRSARRTEAEATVAEETSGPRRSKRKDQSATEDPKPAKRTRRV
ncbi:hypothetical protein C8J56DRAFT_1053015 [Mycena floridula]|nr:hypothetical protein C8J56DRAFT_1053015 [Mycena floridula]